MIPVNPPTVNKNKNPVLHNTEVVNLIFLPPIVAIQLKTFTPVGTAITIVAEVK